MSKKIFVISASPRKGGNSDRLADEWIRGAREAGHHVEKVSLRDHTIQFCRGCLSCTKTQRCVIADDAAANNHKIIHPLNSFALTDASGSGEWRKRNSHADASVHGADPGAE